MHGALCGALFSEMPADISINLDALSEEGRKRVNFQGATICGMCIESSRFQVPSPVAPAAPPANRPPPPRAAAAAAARGNDEDDDEVVIIDPPVQDERKRKATAAPPAARHPGKKIDTELRGYFEFTERDDGMVEWSCRNCPHYCKVAKKFNATKERAHLVEDCDGLSPQEKRTVAMGSQANRRYADMFACAAGTFSTIEDIRYNALNGKSEVELVDLCPEVGGKPLLVPVPSKPSAASSATKGASRRRQTTINSDRNFGPGINREKAEKIIWSELKASLARGEPVNRILDPHVRENLISQHGTGIIPFLPSHEDTIYDKYIIPMSNWAIQQLDAVIQKLPGQINLSMDGATVNGKQKVSTTLLCIIVVNSKC